MGHKTWKNVRVIWIEDGASSARNTVRVELATPAGRSERRQKTIAPAAFLPTLRAARRDEVPVIITTDGAEGGETILKVELAPTPYSRVLDLLDEHVRNDGAFTYGSRKVQRFLIRSTGVVLMVEKFKGGGVEVFAPLTRSMAMDDLLLALNREIHPEAAAGDHIVARPCVDCGDVLYDGAVCTRPECQAARRDALSPEEMVGARLVEDIEHALDHKR